MELPIDRVLTLIVTLTLTLMVMVMAMGVGMDRVYLLVPYRGWVSIDTSRREEM